ncbi:Arabinose 5-phosphate isomerase KdsD [Candidatus Hepatincolaceae symbiont of Richtersius coronifer]
MDIDKKFTDDIIIAKGKRVIEVEIKALEELNQSIGQDFLKVCKLLMGTKGKIILAGIGKSGQIARKIVSTLSSTGSPAFFVHLAEAAHGDLGMIRFDDVVIAISNSGNSVELAGVLNYVSRFNIPLVAITSNPNSELAKAAQYHLLLPPSVEACSLGLAPTSSTTNTLALGDAIAVTLLELKGFSQEDFKIFHPGGALGNKLLKVKKIMHTLDEVPLIKEHSLMSEAIIVITSYKFGCIGIINDKQEMIGIITDGDIRKSMDKNFLNKTVEAIMTKSFAYIHKETNSAKALALMQEKKITSLFILEDKKPLGIIHIHDLLKMGVI